MFGVLIVNDAFVLLVDAPGGPSAGAIVGIVFGGLIGAMFLIALFFVVLYRTKGTPVPFLGYSRFGTRAEEADSFDNPNYAVQMSDGTSYGSASTANPFGPAVNE